MTKFTLFIFALFLLTGVFSLMERSKRRELPNGKRTQEELNDIRKELAALREQMADITLEMRELQDALNSRPISRLDE